MLSLIIEDWEFDYLWINQLGMQARRLILNTCD